MTHRRPDRAPARTYPAYSPAAVAPLLLTRETAVIALLVAVVLVRDRQRRRTSTAR